MLRVFECRVVKLYKAEIDRGTLQARIHVLTQDESTELKTEIQKDFGVGPTISETKGPRLRFDRKPREKLILHVVSLYYTIR